MKIILSRKGFDSTSGGIPNVILPNGEFVVFPIPDSSSPIAYSHIRTNVNGYQDIGQVISDLGVTPTANAHLDPDLDELSLKRQQGWKPIFGQADASLSHLISHGVGEGDLFLFFAWFRQAEFHNGKIRYKKPFEEKHVIYGYLKVGDVLDSKVPTLIPSWATYHPHLAPSNPRGKVFVASDRVRIGMKDYEGGGMFSGYSDARCLTAKNASRSRWSLPTWFYPTGTGRTPLSYHGNKNRWVLNPDDVSLKSCSRGQEFVLDAHQYPESKDWLQTIFK
jgi:hypothetical protein